MRGRGMWNLGHGVQTYIQSVDAGCQEENNKLKSYCGCPSLPHLVIPPSPQTNEQKKAMPLFSNLKGMLDFGKIKQMLLKGHPR